MARNGKYRVAYSKVGARVTDYSSLASLGDDRSGLLHIHSLSSRHLCSRECGQKSFIVILSGE
jgi:hypothetical protein